nr:hypothetical transcript [Hymenolepis microstoma]
MSEEKDEPKVEPVWKTIHIKENRDRCWAARDEFYTCVLDVQVQKMKRPFDPIDYSQCREIRKRYRSVCPGTWIKLYDKRHNYVPGRDVEDEDH